MKERCIFAVFVLFCGLLAYACAERVMYVPKLGNDETPQPVRRGITAINPNATYGLEFDFGHICPLEPASLCGTKAKPNNGLIDL
jgi:hypothetical protein